MLSFHKLVDLAAGSADSEFVDKKWLRLLLHLIVKESKFNSMEVDVGAEEKVDCASEYENLQVTSLDSPENSENFTNNSLRESLEHKIMEMQASISEIMPQLQSDQYSLKDMYRRLNVYKRVEALEEGILKIAGLMKETNCVLETHTQKLKNLSNEMKNLHPEVDSVRRLSDNIDEYTSIQTRNLESINSATEKVVTRVKVQIQRDIVNDEGTPRFEFKSGEGSIDAYRVFPTSESSAQYSTVTDITEKMYIGPKETKYGSDMDSTLATNGSHSSSARSSTSIPTKAMSLVSSTLNTAAKILSESQMCQCKSSELHEKYQALRKLTDEMSAIQEYILEQFKQNSRMFGAMEAMVKHLISDIERRLKITEYSHDQHTAEFEEKLTQISQQLTNFVENMAQSCMDVQESLKVKADESSLDNVKESLQSGLKTLEEKIKSLDCQVPIAAGACKKIGGLSCISCTQKVIQLDCVMTATKELYNERKGARPAKPISKAHYFSLPSRYCGGRHTVTGPPAKRSK